MQKTRNAENPECRKPGMQKTRNAETWKRGHSVNFSLHQRARFTVGSEKTGGIEDPAVDQLLQSPLGVMVEHSRATQGMEIAIGVEAQLGGAMVAMDQLLAGVAEGLEVADGVGMLQSGHERGWP
jgi:hypothetical protein